MSDCIFCKIVAGLIPAELLWEDSNVIVFRDMNPRTPTHVLVVPKNHLVTFADFEEGQGEVLLSMSKAVKEVAKAEGVADSGYRLIMNNGPDGGQEVLHLHMHLFGGRPVGPMIKRVKPQG